MRHLRHVMWAAISAPIWFAVVFAGSGSTHPGVTATPAPVALEVRPSTPRPTAVFVPITASPAPPPPTEPPTPEPTEEPPPELPPPEPPPPEPVRQPVSQGLSLAQQLVSLINSRRAQNGLSPLAQNSALTAAAQQYADFHFATSPSALSHNLDGGPGDRTRKQGYNGGIGEVLASSPASAEEIFGAWMSSPAHYAILMDAVYKDIGLGCAQGPSTDGRYLWALCVGDVGYPP